MSATNETTILSDRDVAVLQAALGEYADACKRRAAEDPAMCGTWHEAADRALVLHAVLNISEPGDRIELP